jgi:hypothetical protein
VQLKERRFKPLLEQRVRSKPDMAGFGLSIFRIGGLLTGFGRDGDASRKSPEFRACDGRHSTVPPIFDNVSQVRTGASAPARSQLFELIG